MSWLQYHLETFVKPVLGKIPDSEELPPFISSQEMTRIKNMWRTAKTQSKGKKLLLPGRDVWIFEVLARRENFPTLFIPQCSRLALSLFSFDNPEQYFILDTGFLGSIPKGLGVKNFLMVSFYKQGDLTQVFPNMGKSRALAIKLEYLPKYWKSGFHRDTYIGQEFSDLGEFRKAAILTQQIYKDSSPKFMEKRLDKRIVEQDKTAYQESYLIAE